jgi:hypothetical protein
MSTGGAPASGSSCTNWPPVVQQQPHRRGPAAHLAQRGLRDVRRMAVVRRLRRPARGRPGDPVARRRRGTPSGSGHRGPGRRPGV